jgi:hypothetical protein
MIEKLRTISTCFGLEEKSKNKPSEKELACCLDVL